MRTEDPLLAYADRHPLGLDGFLQDLERTAGMSVLAPWPDPGKASSKLLPGNLARWPHAQVLTYSQLLVINRVREQAGLRKWSKRTVDQLYLRVAFGEENWTPQGAKLSGVSGNRMVPIGSIRAQSPRDRAVLARLQAPGLEDDHGQG